MSRRLPCGIVETRIIGQLVRESITRKLKSVTVIKPFAVCHPASNAQWDKSHDSKQAWTDTGLTLISQPSPVLSFQIYFQNGRQGSLGVSATRCCSWSVAQGEAGKAGQSGIHAARRSHPSPYSSTCRFLPLKHTVTYFINFLTSIWTDCDCCAFLPKMFG